MIFCTCEAVCTSRSLASVWFLSWFRQLAHSGPELHAPQSQHSPVVSKHTSMLISSARSSTSNWFSLHLFAPTPAPPQCPSPPPSHLLAPAPALSPFHYPAVAGSGDPEEGSRKLSLLTKTSNGPPRFSSSQQSGGRVAPSRAEPHGRAFLDVLTSVVMKLLGASSSLVSHRFFGRRALGGYLFPCPVVGFSADTLRFLGRPVGYASLPLLARRARLRRTLAIRVCAIQRGFRGSAWIQLCHLTADSPGIHCSTSLRQHTSALSHPQPNTHVVIIVTFLELTEHVRHASDIPRQDNTFAVNVAVGLLWQHAIRRHL